MKTVQYFLIASALIFSSIAIAGDPNEPNDSFGTATPLSCDFDNTFALITPNSDVDYFVISGPPGQLIFADIDAEDFGSDLDSILGAFNSIGGMLGFSDDDRAPDDDFSSFDSFLIVEIPADGTVFLAVASAGNENFNGSGNTTGEYDLSIECLNAPTPLEPGDLLASTGSRGSLISLDTTDGMGSFRFVVGDFGPITEIEFAPDGTLIGALGSFISELIEIDTQTGNETFRCDHANGQMTGLEYVGSTLYGALGGGFGSPSSLVTIGDPVGGTCAVTTIGPTGFTNLGGLAYSVGDDILYACVATGSDEAELLDCDRATGACSSIGLMGFSDCASLEFAPDGTLYAGAGGNSGEAGALFTVDTNTGVATELGFSEFEVLSGLAFIPTGGADTDGDGIFDVGDNCRLLHNPDQTDSNADGIGNRCDPDIAGPMGAGDDDCTVNFLDLNVFRTSFFSNPASPNWNPDADLTGSAGVPDNSVNFIDLQVVRELFFQKPGPSGAPNPCLPDLTIVLTAPTEVDCTAGPTLCVHTIHWMVQNFTPVDVTTPFRVRLSLDTGSSILIELSMQAAMTGSGASFQTGPGVSCFNPTCVTTGEVDINDDITEFNEENNTTMSVD